MIDYAIPQTPPPARSPLVWPLAGIGLLVVLNVIINPAFLKITTLDGHLYGMPIDILNQGSRAMLLALGMTLVIATGGIDLAVGSLMAVAGSTAALLLVNHGVSLPVAMIAAIGVTMLGGLCSGLMVSWLGLQPIVATLIMMTAGRGVAQKLTNSEVIVVQNPAFEYLGNGFFVGLPFSILVVAVFYFAAYFFLRRTAAGLFVEAVGDNETAARFAGLATSRVKGLVYVFSGLCAGAAGLLAASNIRAADPYKAGEMMELDAIFAVVVGGTALTGGRFLIAGAFVGALLLQTLTTTMYVIGVKPSVAPVPKALLIIVVCLMQSEKTRAWLRGLFRRKAS
jgi:Ribose/xylose/arabinose/galactoside ABC-type transport systems, permease components